MLLTMLFAAAEKTLALSAWGESALIALIVGLAAAYIGWQSWQTITGAKKKDGSCGGGCHSCANNQPTGAAGPIKLVTIDGAGSFGKKD